MTLNGQVTDDSQPVTGTLALSWQAVSEPGGVTFGAAQQASTTATFSTAGAYVLRLTASDGSLSSGADVVVNVRAAAVQPPPGDPRSLAVPGWIGAPANESTVSGLVPISLAAGVTLQQGTVDYWPADAPAR
jgi:hypothetical protein